MHRLLHLALLLLVAPAICALVVESDAGDANTGPPAPDPGWANIGRRSGYGAIYLGNGWVITARHVGVGDVVLGGVTHRALPESAIRLGKPGRPPVADLVVFRIEPRPDLPALPIRPTPPEVGDRALLIGAGCNRGEHTSWNGKTGWTWVRLGAALGHEPGSPGRHRRAAGDNVTPGFAWPSTRRETRFEGPGRDRRFGRRRLIPRNGRYELAGILIAVAGSRPACQHRVYGTEHRRGSLGLRRFARSSRASALSTCASLAHERP